ncbi:MAG: EI24 domain-containing protein [Rhizobiales bacterium]|nr:EI24 domain-containing protein [Hyphomicrobiales bacterium]MBI3673235.1 EI24 domain-containing protein [Hyphomicrobiales bacterium]
MIPAAVKALADLAAPGFRAVLGKAIALTLALFIVVFVAVEVLIAGLTLLPWPWAEALLAIGTGVALVAAFFFLMAPVIALFAGLFLDAIAAEVERRHYPRDPPGQPLGSRQAIVIALRFGAMVLLVNLAALPLVFTGVGAAALVAINAYLIGREYFEMAAMRHLGVDEARELRQRNGPLVFAAGLLPALLALVPILNLAVPLFATSYFVHLFKRVSASSR